MNSQIPPPPESVPHGLAPPFAMEPARRYPGRHEVNPSLKTARAAVSSVVEAQIELGVLRDATETSVQVGSRACPMWRRGIRQRSAKLWGGLFRLMYLFICWVPTYLRAEKNTVRWVN